jgi:hypothetical protein
MVLAAAVTRSSSDKRMTLPITDAARTSCACSGGSRFHARFDQLVQPRRAAVHARGPPIRAVVRSRVAQLLDVQGVAA